ncbi:MAG: YdcF family protein [Anaerolineaceae bacterium]|nr:YdcF family protein [Anaerolineaceae bacterium]MCB9098152.1 YdcF family protein [Anaerolineales bacterium]
MRTLKRLMVLAVLSFAIVLVAPWALRLWVNWQYRPVVFSPGQDIPAADVAIVFGAGLRWDGRPTSVLHDRVVTAVDLYKNGTVKKLLMSGDNRFDYHNEPGSMRDLALELGVPDEDIVLDYAGRRTYDTCYRAGAIFGVKKAILVTQRFHLDRALYLCNALDVAAIGVAADRRPYRGQPFMNLREVAALTVAWLDIHVLRPQPVLGERNPIEIARIARP